MTQGDFLSTTQSAHPLRVAAIVGLHAAVLAAALVAKTEFVPSSSPVMVVKSYPQPKVPPPEQVHHAIRQSKPSLDDLPTIPIAKLPENEIKIVDLKPFPDPGPLAGSGADNPVKLSPPILVDAAIDPRFAADFQPDYPDSAVRGGIEGRTKVRVTIGADGRVKDIALIATDDPAFFTETRRQALRRWRFTPATRDGVAVESVKVMNVTFRFRGA